MRARAADGLRYPSGNGHANECSADREALVDRTQPSGGSENEKGAPMGGGAPEIREEYLMP